jgi:spore coat assembly protein SafA
MLNLHRYLYVQANPINMTDPLGLFDWATGTVQSGDTLWAIANTWGTSVDELLRYNPQITNRNLIYPGQHINLPPCNSAKCQALRNEQNASNGGTGGSNCGNGNCGFTYTVRAGDTLSGIGAQLGISWRWIHNANWNIIGSNPNVIYPGQRLYIPCSNPGGGGGGSSGGSGGSYSPDPGGGGDSGGGGLTPIRITRYATLFYEHINFAGDVLVAAGSFLKRGDEDYEVWLGSANDKISSIKLGPKTRLTIYEHVNFGGHFRVFTNNTWHSSAPINLLGLTQCRSLFGWEWDCIDWNDRISSFYARAL